MIKEKDECMTKTTNRRTKIIEVARTLFQAKDYNATTMQEIMDKLDIAKGTIYHYFKSKEDLLEAVIEDLVSKNVNQTEALLKAFKGTSLEKIQLLVKSGNISKSSEKILDHLHRPANDGMHTRMLAKALIKQAPLYARVIQEGCDEGVFKTKSPLECAEFILSAVQFLTDSGIYPWGKEELNRRMQAFPALIEQLLQAPAGSFQFLLEKNL